MEQVSLLIRFYRWHTFQNEGIKKIRSQMNEIGFIGYKSF